MSNHTHKHTHRHTIARTPHLHHHVAAKPQSCGGAHAHQVEHKRHAVTGTGGREKRGCVGERVVVWWLLQERNAAQDIAQQIGERWVLVTHSQASTFTPTHSHSHTHTHSHSHTHTYTFAFTHTHTHTQAHKHTSNCTHDGKVRKWRRSSVVL